ncbi:unnamed protein product [Chondrus crispus]|uniref:Uncharacterized protein n=1 Tax=Chondrus crispus TaxID=2769 RepID=R7QJ73_CHOCR|nr:unnamed protein product [Chondrus crispus]CDF38144.1 unnamed protein product [Chondrus crispus]|eukprot:XP_005718013.1 unnamed protein product [Chondrus crispus]
MKTPLQTQLYHREPPAGKMYYTKRFSIAVKMFTF